MCRSDTWSTRRSGHQPGAPEPRPAAAGTRSLDRSRVRKGGGGDRSQAESGGAERSAVGRIADIESSLRRPDETAPMPEPTSLKERLRTDLNEAIKQRNKVRSGTVRMVLSAISEAKVADPGRFTDRAACVDVVIREAKKRREAEEAYAAAGRTELAEKERSESVVLANYLPQQFSAEEISGSSPPPSPAPARLNGALGGSARSSAWSPRRRRARPTVARSQPRSGVS